MSYVEILSSIIILLSSFAESAVLFIVSENISF